MNEQLAILWSLLSNVSDSCAAMTWRNPDDKTSEAPAGWPLEAAKLEYRVFGVFLLSHAMVHCSHSPDSWTAAMEFCVAQVEDEFGEIAVEGDDIEEFVGTRIQAYGDWSEEVRAKGRQHDEPLGWIRILTNNLLACSLDHPLPLKPPAVICAFVKYKMLEIYVRNGMECIYFPVLYGPVAYLCQRHNNVLNLSAEQVDKILTAGLEASRDETHKSKRAGFLRRLFGR